jgi:hypothetical protein
MKSTPKAGVLIQKDQLVPRVLHLENPERNAMKSFTWLLLTILATVQLTFAKELPNAPSAAESSSSMMEPFTPVTPVTSVTSANPLTTTNPVETRIVDKKFMALALISTGSTFSDSYTTLFARDNWLAHRTGVCNMEVESAYLYGVHPTVGRAYAVATVKSAGSLAAAYLLRKHHSKLWSLPLIGNSVISLQGVTQNMINCN